jgi:hypothetical protein
MKRKTRSCLDIVESESDDEGVYDEKARRASIEHAATLYKNGIKNLQEISRGSGVPIKAVRR